MWPDPSHLTKRKPRSLGGTPANKFSAIVCLSTVVAFVTVLHLISYTPAFKRKLERVEKQVLESRERRKVAGFLADPLVQGAIARKQREYEEDSQSDLL